MLSKLLPIFFIAVVISCSDSNDINGVEDKVTESTSFNLNWLEGNWIDSTVFNGRSFFVETWEKENKDAFAGEKFQIVKLDSSSPTKLSITRMDDKFYYSYFEEEEQTTFVQDSINLDFVSFRNTMDKFPEYLSYQRNLDTLLIKFSGMANGVFRSSSFTTILVK